MRAFDDPRQPYKQGDGRVSRFKFVIYPAWFGGPAEADKAIVELANHQARHEGQQVADIRVFRTIPEKWDCTVEFVDRPSY